MGEVRLTEEFVERFLRRVEKTGTCWRWMGPLNRGYGSFHPTRGFQWAAHRFAYEMSNGPIPDGLTVEHRCHTEDESCIGGFSCPHRSCVNPDHLELLTMRENVLLAHSSPFAINARKTHCLRDHPFDEANSYISAKGFRICRECKRLRDAELRRSGRKKRYPVTRTQESA